MSSDRRLTQPGWKYCGQCDEPYADSWNECPVLHAPAEQAPTPEHLSTEQVIAAIRERLESSYMLEHSGGSSFNYPQALADIRWLLDEGLAAAENRAREEVRPVIDAALELRKMRTRYGRTEFTAALGDFFSTLEAYSEQSPPPEPAREDDR